MIVCLECDCPADLVSDEPWLCPMCGCGFVKVKVHLS